MADIATDAVHQLASDLLSRSEQNLVNWAPLGDGDAFIFQGTTSSIVMRTSDGDGRWPYVMELLDEANNVVDSLVTGYEVVSADGDERPLEWNDTVQSLYYRAKRKALRLDELASSLLADIDEHRVGDRALPPPPTRSAESTELDDLPF
jgi:hypothetical protein